MEKSITTREYRHLLVVLREVRGAAGLTQVELAQKIDESQSFISKVERGEIRIDVLQLRTIAKALGTTLPEFVNLFEKSLSKSRRRK